jgi:cytochrome c553
MQTRLMSSRGIRLAIGSLALCFTISAGAQQSLERGKSAAQLYAANCAGCHKSPQSVTKATGNSELESFLREHYTPTPQSAATLAAYLKGLESSLLTGR